MAELKRCPWVKMSNPLYVKYHDEEWGTPVHDDRKHFEFLVLEGAQAGLSWETVLNKRENYRKVFHQFDPGKVAAMTSRDVARLLKDPGIIRNRLKVESAIRNAARFMEVQQAFGSFNDYLWDFTDGKTIRNRPRTLADYPSSTPLSDRVSRDLKQRGFTFIGSTVIYAHLQAVGIVDDHAADCFRAAGHASELAPEARSDITST